MTLPTPRLALCTSLALAVACSSEPRLVPARPLLDVQPLALDFGPVPVGLPSSLTLRLRNRGPVALTLRAVTVAGAGFSVAPVARVEAAQTIDLEVRFTPQTEGTIDGSVTFASDAEGNPEQRVTLQGIGVPRRVCADCNMPPPGSCSASGELVRYAPVGTCVGGRCEYQASVSACPSGCDAVRAACADERDAGLDAGAEADAGAPDAVAPDAQADAGASDVGAPDAVAPDAEADAAAPDAHAGAPDAAAPDAHAGAPDAGSSDAGAPDASPPDAGLCAPGLDERVDLDSNAVPDCAQTLVANSQAAGSVPPWVALVTPPNTATLAFSAVDELSFPGSGSFLVTNTSPVTSANAAFVVGECIPVAPDALYGAWVRYFMASGQPGGDAQAATWIVVEAFADSACTVGVATLSAGTLGSTKDAWGTYYRQVSTADEGTGAYQAVRLRLGVLKGATTAAVSARFDNVLFVRE
jgi:hypothetical protein